MLYFLFALYIFVGLCGYIPVHRFFNARCARSVVCSCKTAASVKDIQNHGRFGRKYLLDYYDHSNTHYLVSFLCKFFPRRWSLNQVLEIYYNPSNPMQISVPDDSGLLNDAHWTARLAFFLYLLFGLFVVFCFAMFG